MKAELIDKMGDDLLVVNAARVSFDKASSYESEAWCPTAEQGGKIFPYNRLKEQDKRLLNYLAKHNHWTPFSHPQICMRETVPIFVARQRFKHMVGFTYNEVSRRYVDDEPEFYTPEVWRSRPEGSVKQGSGSAVVSHCDDAFFGEAGEPIGHVYSDLISHSKSVYNGMLAAGVAPEQARMVLPQSMYTSYYVTGSLAAWARAYKQRIDSNSQIEIQELAKQWGDIIAPLFPESWEALTQ
jgi:thymidylate synthase (FAD)